jgi:hypothetical protein
MQMQALAARGGQPGVNVGACGPMAYNPIDQAAYTAMGPGGLLGAGALAGCQPAPIAANLVSPGEVYQECFVPLGIDFGVDQAGNIYPASQIGLAPNLAFAAQQVSIFPRNGLFYIFGVKFFSGPGLVELDSSVTGDSDYNHRLGSTDIASWNTVECFCPVNWGCISVSNPLRLQAHALTGTLVQPVTGTAWGIRRSALNACSPFGV